MLCTSFIHAHAIISTHCTHTHTTYTHTHDHDHIYSYTHHIYSHTHHIYSHTRPRPHILIHTWPVYILWLHTRESILGGANLFLGLITLCIYTYFTIVFLFLFQLTPCCVSCWLIKDKTLWPVANPIITTPIDTVLLTLKSLSLWVPIG